MPQLAHFSFRGRYIFAVASGKAVEYLKMREAQSAKSATHVKG
jgi:hypothetical protein